MSPHCFSAQGMYGQVLMRGEELCSALTPPPRADQANVTHRTSTLLHHNDVKNENRMQRCTAAIAATSISVCTPASPTSMMIQRQSATHQLTNTTALILFRQRKHKHRCPRTNTRSRNGNRLHLPNTANKGSPAMLGFTQTRSHQSNHNRHRHFRSTSRGMETTPENTCQAAAAKPRPIPRHPLHNFQHAHRGGRARSSTFDNIYDHCTTQS